MSSPTPEQQAIVEAVSAGETVGCNAYAGSGKTTMGRMAEETIPHKRRLNCAFSKRIAVEFDSKMPPGSENRTFNSLGMSSATKLVGRRLNMKVGYGGREKSYQIYEYLGIERDAFPDFDKLMGLAKNHGFIPSQAIRDGSALVEDTDENWQQLIDTYALDLGRLDDSSAISYGRLGLMESVRQCFNDGVFDFDDQLYIPTLWGGPNEVFDFIFVDEYQDLSPIQHKMVMKLCRRGAAQVLLAGDRHQAIYAFRGAMSDSCDVLQAHLNAKPMPLSISFRCARNVVLEAQRYVPEIQYWSGSPDGSVEWHDDWSVSDIQSGDTILCRNTKPLIPVFYSLLAQGVGAKIMGSEIGKGLKTILQRILKDAGEWDPPASRAALLVDEWGEEQYTKYVSKNPVKAAAKREQAFILTQILERHTSTRDALAQLLSMFSDQGGQVTLSTIHKAKGLEWPRVWFLDSWLIPSTYATEPWQLTQEANLAYVGVTRAQRELHYINTRR